MARPSITQTARVQAAAEIPPEEFSILLSHTPEVHQQAAHAGFDLIHTHEGQICLPGGIPVMRGGVMPRWIASGPWTYGGMTGYTPRGVGTSIVPVRLNCLPEVTLHHLRAAHNDRDREMKYVSAQHELA